MPAPMSPEQLAAHLRLRERLGDRIRSHYSTRDPGERRQGPVACASATGALTALVLTALRGKA